ncbi:hypothetical protein OG884_21330 [Streptosporangium sp. NBC_01755]|uniref:hypothetical protein n=1 Tax=Streptosporangium sp. NBC_01755 TaxID=2975949 RepID=UPI002DDA537B|nr:hypothetical protein [Streptosporangium sp. NBC_01755]WSC97435.1 hypothetical protein OG884_21330 [Streptosporangium sp. NBC_01755]
MLKSKTRRRVAVKTAAIAAAGAGVFFGAVPAVASMYADPNPVSYACTLAGVSSPSATYTFQMDLTGPTAAATNSPLVATWKIAQPATGPTVTPTAPAPAGARVVIDAEVQIGATPSPVLALPSELRSVAATAAPPAAGQPITAPPLLVTVTPSATGVVAFQPGPFTLYLDPGTGTGNEAELLDCGVPLNSAEVTAAALRVVVGTAGPSTSASSSTSTSPSPSPSASQSTSAGTTPKPTVTVTRTKTSKPAPSRQIDETPEGAASTGGGGDAGPDARMIMFSGLLMVAFAGIGGLVLRRRTAGRG